jgi:hypothetical protein
MTSQPARENYSALLERLQKLERDNRRMKRVGAVVLVATAALILMGQAGKNRTLDADSLVIRDASGNTRIELGTLEDHSPVLRMFGGASNKPLVLLSSNQERSELKFFNGGFNSGSDSPQPSIALSSYQKGSGLTFTYPGCCLIMLSNSDNPALLMGDSTAGTQIRPASINTFDNDENFSAVLGRTDLLNPKTGATTQTSAATLTLFGKGKKVIWQAP